MAILFTIGAKMPAGFLVLSVLPTQQVLGQHTGESPLQECLELRLQGFYGWVRA
ncbi:hypothetical protein SynA15127_01504 [Synechococcus sp. A15-127]|uniref:hypothetical protein n=1 Tax=Synechococcus sp. A15-127 TaxID=1050624 RepID=UPI001648445E|nr:hypothetical protein [Synechococcus sp. A15-127]QNI94582.1 hypothetical protein SynA15127_01504 [Synechococcus sp. A15-127]